VHTLRVAMATVVRLKAHVQMLASAVSCQSVFERQAREGDSNLVDGDFTQTVERVKALIACHVFSVACRPVTGHSVTRVKWAWYCADWLKYSFTFNTATDVPLKVISCHCIETRKENCTICYNFVTTTSLTHLSLLFSWKFSFSVFGLKMLYFLSLIFTCFLQKWFYTYSNSEYILSFELLILSLFGECAFRTVL
jgi:hypothetical protein